MQVLDKFGNIKEAAPSGYSGFVGASGTSGVSGFSSISGVSGFSGTSGVSGLGLSGFSGTSGTSGFIGQSGFSGFVADGSLITVTNSVQEGITTSFADITFDTNNNVAGNNISHSTVTNTNRIVINTAGNYVITYSFIMQNAKLATAQCKKNGAAVLSGSTFDGTLGPAGSAVYTYSFTATFAAGDYFTLQLKAQSLDNAENISLSVDRCAAGNSGYSGTSGAIGAAGAQGTSGYSGAGLTNIITVAFDPTGPKPGFSTQSIAGTGQVSLFPHIIGSKLIAANTLQVNQIFEYSFWGRYAGTPGGAIAVPTLALYMGPSLPYAGNAAIFSVSVQLPLDTTGAAGNNISWSLRGQFMVGSLGGVFSSEIDSSYLFQTQYATNSFSPGNIPGVGFQGLTVNQHIDTTVNNNIDLVVSWSATTPSNTMFLTGGYIRRIN